MTVIETARLRLREYTMADLDALYQILSDAETMKHYPAPYDRARTKGWIDWCLNSYRTEGFGLWAVELKETGAFIGDCGLSLQNIDGETLPEIGYHICRPLWRQGYASEAGRAVRDWGFEKTGYGALYSYMTTDNIASVRTALSIGLKKIGEFDDPRYGRMAVCALTRAEWEKMTR